MNRPLSFDRIFAMMLILTYLVVLALTYLAGKLDLVSFIFGMALGYWFRADPPAHP